MGIIVQIFLIIVGLLLSYFLNRHTQKIADYTKVVAKCNEKLSEETQRLRQIAEASWYDKEFVSYLSNKYYDRIEKWPPSSSGWWAFPPTEEEKPKVFRMYCRQIILESLFPQTKSIEGEIVTTLKKKGFGFKKENQPGTWGSK